MKKLGRSPVVPSVGSFWPESGTSDSSLETTVVIFILLIKLCTQKLSLINHQWSSFIMSLNENTGDRLGCLVSIFWREYFMLTNDNLAIQVHSSVLFHFKAYSLITHHQLAAENMKICSFKFSVTVT